MTRRPDPSSNSRDDRLRAALRANLARRKAQARARTDNDNEKPPAGDERPDQSAASED